MLAQTEAATVPAFLQRGAESPTRLRFECRLLILLISGVWLLSFVFGFQPALLVQSALGFSASLAGLKRPAIGILGLGMLATLDPLSRGLLQDEGLWRWNTFNYLLLAITIRYLDLLLRVSCRRITMLLLFSVVLALDLLATEDFANGIQNLLGVISAFGLAAYAIRAAVIPGIWYWLGLVNGFLGATGGLLYYLHRAELPYLNPNAFVHFPLGALLSVCLAFLEIRSVRQLRAPVALALINLVWVFLTGSRGGMLVGLVGAAYVVWRLKAVMRNWLTVGFGMFGCAMVFVVIALSFPGGLGTGASGRFLKLFDTERSIGNRTSGRSDIAVAGWDIFKNNPLGIGTGSFDIAYAELDIEDLAFQGHNKQAHSGWIKILAENGVPGILLLIVFIGSFATDAIKTRLPNLRPLGFLTAIVFAVALLATEFQSKDLWLLAMSVTAIFHFGTHASVTRNLVSVPSRRGKSLAIA